MYFRFCDVTQRISVAIYRLFGTTYRISSSRAKPYLNIEPLSCPETLVTNSQHASLNATEERRSHVHCSESNTSRKQYVTKAIRHESNTSRKQYVTKAVRHESNASRKQCVTKAIRHESNTSRKQCVTKAIRHESNTSRKQYVTKAIRHESNTSRI